MLRIDCHNDRHDHDIREGRDGYEPEPGLWERLRQAVFAVVGGLVVLPIHGAGVYVLLTQSVGSPLWIAGLGYLLVLTAGIVLRPVQSAALYTVAGTVGLAITQELSSNQIGGESASVLLVSAWVPAILAAAWWYQR